MYIHTHIHTYPIKRWSISLIIRDMQIRTISRYHFSRIRLVKIKRYNTFFGPGYYRGDRHFHTLLVESKLIQSFQTGAWQLNTHYWFICFWPTIPLLGMHSEDTSPMEQSHTAAVSLTATLLVTKYWENRSHARSMESSWTNAVHSHDEVLGNCKKE